MKHILAAGLMALFVTPVSAATVTLTFSGLVSADNISIVSLGDRVSATIVLDDAAVGALRPGLTGLTYDITSLSVSIPGDRTDTFADQAFANVRNDCTTGCVPAPNPPAIDGFSFQAQSGFEIARLNLSTFDTSVLGDESLTGVIALFNAGVVPAAGLFLSVTTRGDLTTGLDRYGADCGRLDSCQFQVRIDAIGVQVDPGPAVVPLPAAGWMLLAGLGGLAALRRRIA